MEMVFRKIPNELCFGQKKAVEQDDSQAMTNLGKFYKELGQLNEAFNVDRKSSNDGKFFG